MADLRYGFETSFPPPTWPSRDGNPPSPIHEHSGLKFGGARHVINNPHIYSDHEEGLREMLERQPYLTKPTMEIPDWVNSYEDILKVGVHGREYVKVGNYSKGEKHLPISLEMVV